MAYGDFKDLPKRIASNKVLHDSAFEIASNPDYEGYQYRLTNSWIKNLETLLFTDGPEL